MSKLINQDAAKEALFKRSQTFTDPMFSTPGECNVARVVALECASIIMQMKGIDAVEVVDVVRCKNCKHWGSGWVGETECIKECKVAHYMIGENGYCAYGEARNG
jgi:hypothetical protein